MFVPAGVSHKPKQPKQPKQPSECSEPSEPKYHRAGTRRPALVATSTSRIPLPRRCMSRGIQTAAALAAQSGSKRQGAGIAGAAVRLKHLIRRGSSRCGGKVSHNRGKLSIEAGTQLVVCFFVALTNGTRTWCVVLLSASLTPATRT